MGAPMVAEEVLAYLSTIISVAFAGRLGGYSLGVFTLSHALTNISGGGTCEAGRLGGCACGEHASSIRRANSSPTDRVLLPCSAAGIALLNGVTGAVDTFASQAHGSRTFPAIGACMPVES